MLLSDICLSVTFIGPKSITEMPRKTKSGTEVAHVTPDSDTTFMVKGQGHQAALLSAALTHTMAAAVGVGPCWPRETAATLPSARPRETLRRPRGRRGAGHVVADARLQLFYLRLLVVHHHITRWYMTCLSSS